MYLNALKKLCHNRSAYLQIYPGMYRSCTVPTTHTLPPAIPPPLKAMTKRDDAARVFIIKQKREKERDGIILVDFNLQKKLK